MEPEGCWDAWFDGLAGALRGRTTPPQGRALEGADLIDPVVWPRVVAWLRTLPVVDDDYSDDPEVFV